MSVTEDAENLTDRAAEQIAELKDAFVCEEWGRFTASGISLGTGAFNLRGIGCDIAYLGEQ